ncbi:MAG: hypothetical protein VKJ66_01485 [Synechococcus sp.]|nr:hypothetical protein [Synechococcus sp.]
MPSPGALMLNLMLGFVGMAYLLYGRRESALVPLVCGILLLIAPYLVPGTWPQLLVGAVLIALPWVLRR